ncbi:bile acid:sodium symporter family protein [Jeongeupia sp. USM3]|uniref:bile acid:sodium symporter family protein n=1 Tax=Jeongeupia sp. USM3 TaxID=1906741 RepID=UPI000A7AA57A|nr:bile acid:sodium symporter family protein [Jeongeupia sp. USM3]
MSSLRKFVDGFLLSLLIAIVLANLAPSLGASGGVLHMDWITAVGISVVFFLNGASLAPERLRAGAANWRLHLLVTTSTFVIFPLIGTALYFGLGHWLPAALLLGVFYLCALPSTVSSSVAMTSMARGNVAGAVFNATLSSLLGMLVTPLLVGLLFSHSGEGLSLLAQLRAIAIQLFLPFVLGQLARPWLKDVLLRHRQLVSYVDRGVIVAIVYNSFCDSAMAHIWSDYSAGMLLGVAVIVSAVLFVALQATRFAARRFGFNTEDEIAAVFCGSKKSLAAGIPMAKLIFGAHPALGLIVLPIMFYHQIQLFVCSIIARRYAARPD